MRRGGRGPVTALLAVALTGCEVVPQPVHDLAAGDRAAPASEAPAAVSRTTRVVARFQALGSIPFDNMTLPLISPAGRYAATQTGIAPTWSTVLARDGAAVPRSTRIEIYDLSRAPADGIARIATVDAAVVLGRACAVEGFLVEAPRDDGSRWIGLAAWETGRVRWLVQDAGTVAAFASLGPDGQLAYSARRVGGEHSDLVVAPLGARWRLPADRADWLMPTWSGAGDGLFVLRLEGGSLDLVHFDAANESAMRRTVERLPIARSNADVGVAYQTLVAQPATMDVAAEARDEIVFLHPTRLRAALWRPPAPMVLLDPATLAAIVDPEDPESILVAHADELVRRDVANADARTRLLGGMLIPRATSNPERRFVLLAPGDGTIALTGMVLLPAE